MSRCVCNTSQAALNGIHPASHIESTQVDLSLSSIFSYMASSFCFVWVGLIQRFGVPRLCFGFVFFSRSAQTNITNSAKQRFFCSFVVTTGLQQRQTHNRIETHSEKMVATHRATAGAWLDSRDDDHSSSMIGDQHSLYDDEQGSLVYPTPNNNSTGAKQGIPSTAVVSSSRRMAPPPTTTAPTTTSSSSWLWCGLSALVNGSTTPVTESAPKRTMFDTHGTDVASLPTILLNEPATSRTAKQDLAAPSTCTYAPYLKVEIPRVLVVLDEDDRSNSDSDDDSSAPSKGTCLQFVVVDSSAHYTGRQAFIRVDLTTRVSLCIVL